MKKALTLVEVILSLGIMALGIVLGMELMGKLSNANTQISAAERLQQRVWQTRQLIEEADFTTISDIFQSAEVWQVSPSAIARQNDDLSAPSHIGIPLSVELLDSNNTAVFTFAMIKHIDSGHE